MVTETVQAFLYSSWAVSPDVRVAATLGTYFVVFASGAVRGIVVLQCITTEACGDVVVFVLFYIVWWNPHGE